MTNIYLRPAVANDLAVIKALARAAHINLIGLKWPRFVVVENDLGKVIVCGQIKPHRDDSHELASLVIDPSYRGQGIARSLVEHLIQHHEGDLCT